MPFEKPSTDPLPDPEKKYREVREQVHVIRGIAQRAENEAFTSKKRTEKVLNEVFKAGH